MKELLQILLQVHGVRIRPNCRQHMRNLRTLLPEVVTEVLDAVGAEITWLHIDSHGKHNAMSLVVKIPAFGDTEFTIALGD